jgi:hypothetical protein
MPGTQLIGAPYPAAVTQDVSYQALHKSSQAPPVWRPSIYYQPSLSSRFGGAIDSDNQMPVPALAPNQNYKQDMGRPIFLRQQQVGWPVNAPKYAWRT